MEIPARPASVANPRMKGNEEPSGTPMHPQAESPSGAVFGRNPPIRIGYHYDY
jgi:hypothetical protein